MSSVEFEQLSNSQWGGDGDIKPSLLDGDLFDDELELVGDGTTYPDKLMGMTIDALTSRDDEPYEAGAGAGAGSPKKQNRSKYVCAGVLVQECWCRSAGAGVLVQECGRSVLQCCSAGVLECWCLERCSRERFTEHTECNHH